MALNSPDFFFWGTLTSRIVFSLFLVSPNFGESISFLRPITSVELSQIHKSAYHNAGHITCTFDICQFKQMFREDFFPFYESKVYLL